MRRCSNAKVFHSQVRPRYTKSLLIKVRLSLSPRLLVFSERALLYPFRIRKGIMCFDLVSYAEYSCRHRVEIARQRMDCNGRKCAFSQLHGRQNHDCEATCLQMLQPSNGIVVEDRPEKCGPHCFS
ncbi:hypothetical protein DFH11DRAFT_711788 [Phellopilus nigrolimitatus]|nr:hypothetical protein DFH11DRAFT_711788 [Phellopilus nigrolimitatus]